MSSPSTNLTTEQRTLKLSIAATLAVAVFGIVAGLACGSFSIAFDGFYSLGDASMSALALSVSRAILTYTTHAPNQPTGHPRFSMGYWHLEPIVLGLNAALLTGIAVYALLTAIGSLLEGGRDLAFDFAIVYASLTLLVCMTMAIVEARINKRLNSAFVALDVKSWLMSGGITLALLIAFVAGYFIEDTRYGHLTPYIDPATLALVCLAIIPLPIGTLKRALADILLIAPDTLRRHVEQVAQAVVERHGFSAYRAYVARVGRSKQVELHFIVPAQCRLDSVAALDRIRDEVDDAIGDGGPHRWLTIAFTSDPKWAS